MFQIYENATKSSEELNVSTPLIPDCMKTSGKGIYKRIQCQIDWYQIMPQLLLLDEIHYSEPNATFILEFRPMIDWINSMKAWKDMRRRWNKHSQPGLLVHSNREIPVYNQYSNNDPSVTKSIKQQFSDTDIAMWFCRHVTRLREFVKLHPSHDLIEIDIYDSNTTSDILTKLFGGSNKKCWGQSNANALINETTAIRKNKKKEQKQ